MLAPALLADLARTLAAEGARVAYLFGSHARGTAGALSDVDLAVLFGRPMPAAESLDHSLSVMAAVSSLLPARPDVVVLDTAPAELKYAIIGEGIVFLNTDDDLRASFEARAVSEYLDTEYMRSVQRRHLYRHIREDHHAC